MINRICVLVILLFPFSVYAQDTILLTNGKVKEGKMLFRDNNWIYYGIKERQTIDESKYAIIENKYKQKREKVKSNTKKDTLTKLFALELIKANEVRDNAKVKFNRLIRARTDNIFSIIHPDGKEEIIYSPDTLGFLVLDVVEPELDLSVDEMRKYIYGCQDGMNVNQDKARNISGVVGGVGAGFGAFFGPIAPSVYIIILGASKQRPDENLVAHPELVFDENYLEGYKKSARKQKIIAATQGGLIGLSFGMFAYQIIFRNL